MTQTVKHGIFIISLVASIGMLIFGHYAYGASEQSFGGVLDYQYKPPFFCNGQYAPFAFTAGPNPNKPTGYTEIAPESDHVNGSIKDGVQILGLYSLTPSSNCYQQIGTYRKPIKTTIFTYFGTSRLPSY